MSAHVVGPVATFSLAPIAVPLHDPASFPFGMPPSIRYEPVNHRQEQLLALASHRDRYPPLGRSLRTRIGQDEAALTRHFSSEGLTLQMPKLRPAPAGGESFGIAAIMRLMGFFTNTERGTIECEHGTFPAAVLPSSVTYRSSPLHRHPIAVIHSTSTDLGDDGGRVGFRDLHHYELGVTPLDEPLEGLALAELASVLSHNLTRPREEHGALIIPMVNARHQPDLSWMKGLETTDLRGRPVVCDAAGQENWLRLSDEGFILTSGTAFAMGALCAGGGGPDFVIRQPFLLWIAVRETPLLFAAYLPPSAWSDPGPLSPP